MKKISTTLGMLFALVLLFTSCQEDVESWNSETLDYSGRYIVRLLSEDMSETYVDYGTEIQIYNTAANKPNEVWIDDFEALFPLKSKFFLSGSPSSFRSTESGFDKLTDNPYAFGMPDDAPEGDGEDLVEERYYLRAELLDGKITPKSFTTKGGNITSGIQFTIKLYSGTVSFRSYTLPESQWKNPTTPEYAWKMTGIHYDSSMDETYIVEGFLYTGFDEDEY